MQLRRLFGAWPPKCFAALPAGWQEQFWQDVEGKSGGAELEKFVIDAITLERVEQESTKHGGEYLPLSVYEQRGFCVADIESKCTDTEMHEVLGKTYRVRIKSVWSKAIEQMVRKELLNGRCVAKVGEHHDKKHRDVDDDDDDEQGVLGGKSRKRDKKEKHSKRKKKHSGSRKHRKKAKSDTDDSSTPDKTTGTSDKDESDGNNNSTSHSESEKKHKKSAGSKKDNKNDKNAKKKRKKAAAMLKEKNRAAKASVRLATRTIAKTSAVFVTLRQGLADPHVKFVPSFAKDPAKKSLHTLENIVKKAEACIQSQGLSVCTWTVEELDCDYKLAVQNSSLLTKMLDTARKHTKAD
jgi:hypothetical protein